MHYPKLSPLREYRMRVPLPSGGICQSQDARTLRDDQMPDACNLWQKDGLLCSRPSLTPAYTFSLQDLCEADDQILDVRLCHEETVTGSEAESRLLVTVQKADLTKSIGMFLVDRSGKIHTEYPLWIHGLENDETALYIEPGGEDGVPMLLKDSIVHSQVGAVSKFALPYIPLLAMRAKGNAQHIPTEVGGVPFEARNLLTDAFRIEYVVTEDGIFFHLPPKLDLQGALRVTCTATDGTAVQHNVTLTDAPVCYEETASAVDALRLSYSRVTHCFCFVDDQEQAQDMSQYPYVTLEARFLPSSADDAPLNPIRQTQFCVWFGGDRSGLTGGTRLFAAGHPSHPHLVYYSALNDPTYFPENSYFYVGSSADPVTAFGKQGNLLVIFKKHEIYYVDYNATPLNATAATEGGVVDAETQSASFPLTPLNAGVGCDCPQSLALCRDRLIWCDSDGNVYLLGNSNAYSLCNVRSIGKPIAPLLRQCSAEELRCACGWYSDNRYYLSVGHQIFLLDLSSTLSDTDAIWYRWELPCTAFGGAPIRDTAYWMVRLQDASVDRIVTYHFADGGTDHIQRIENGTVKEIALPIASFFESKAWDFSSPEQYKNVRLLTLSGDGEGMQHLRIRCSDEYGGCRGEITASAGHDTVVRCFPACRHIRRFGLKVSTHGTVRYDGISLLYSVYHR